MASSDYHGLTIITSTVPFAKFTASKRLVVLELIIFSGFSVSVLKVREIVYKLQ